MSLALGLGVGVGNRASRHVSAPLTASNRVAVTDGTQETQKSTAFPSMVLCPNGDYITHYGRGSSHNHPDSFIEQQRSTDAGATWGGEASVFNIGSQADAGSILSRVGTRIYSVRTIDDYSTGLNRRVLVSWSDNSGVAWSAGVDIGGQGFDYRIAGGSGIFVAQDDGKLLMPVYGRSQAQVGYTALLLESADDALTWGIRGTIAGGTADEWEEPQLHYLDDGRLMCLLRVDGNHTIQRNYSSDHGRTFTTPEVVCLGFGWPAWAQFTNTEILMMTRHYDSAYNLTVNDPKCYGELWTSRDRGVSFRSRGRLSSEFYVYGDIFEKSANVAAVIHAQASAAVATTATIEYLELAVN